MAASKTKKHCVTVGGKEYQLPKRLDADAYMHYLEVRDDIMGTERKSGLYTAKQFRDMMECIVELYDNQFTVEELKDRDTGLGVDGIISGGQTMNPSTEDILREIARTPAETVFVLPNNKNIIMAAQQCVGLASRKVVVVPTETIPQGVTAMMNVDPEMEPEELLEVMKSSISGVATAQITYAARNSDFDGFAINAGDYLSLLDGKLFGTNQDINVMLEKLAEKAEEKGAEFVTLFYGEDVTGEQAAQAEEIFAKHCPGAELSVLPGGQPVYYYIISIE